VVDILGEDIEKGWGKRKTLHLDQDEDAFANVMMMDAFSDK